MTTSRTKTAQRINRSLAEGLPLLGRYWTCFRGRQSQCGALLQYRHSLVFVLFWKGSSVVFLTCSDVRHPSMMHYIVFTELSMASSLVRMPQSPLPKQHDLHRKSGMFSQQPNAVFLVPWNAKCGRDHRNSDGFQLDHCRGSLISLAFSLRLHHQGHHGESYRYLRYGHLSLCRAGHLFLQSGDASRDGRWRYLFVYTQGE